MGTPRSAIIASLMFLVYCASQAPPSPIVSSDDSRPEERLRLPGYLRGSKDGRARRVIVFVHGLFGDGQSTWTNPKTKAYFPRLIANDPVFEGVDIWVHEFETPTLRRSYTIDELADHLRKHLNNDNVIVNHDEVIFVAHSMGGLVARAYLLKYRNPQVRVPMVYFFATPTTGGDLARLGSLISANPQLTDMRKMTTDDQRVLGVWDAQWASSSYPEEILSYCAYELRETLGTFIVQRESARALCNTRPDPIASNHINIVKPADDHDESYIALREAYRDTFDGDRRDSDSTPAWNLSATDTPLLRVKNDTQQPRCTDACWSDRVTVAPGDEITFDLTYRNRSFHTAKNARLNLAIPAYPLMAFPITATISAENTLSAAGQVLVRALAPVLLVPKGFEQRQALPFGQAPGLLTTEGLRLGDISQSKNETRIRVTYRCEPVTLLALGERELDAAFSTLKELFSPDTDVGEFCISCLESPPTKGHVDYGEFGEATSWVPEVTGLQSESGFLAHLYHFNNTADALEGLRAELEFIPESATAAILQVVLRSTKGVERRAKARLTFAEGHRPQAYLSFATIGPRDLLHMSRGLRGFLSRVATEDVMPPQIRVVTPPQRLPTAFELGTLPQQSLAFATLFVSTDEYPPEEPPPPPTGQAVLRGIDGASLRVRPRREHSREWVDDAESLPRDVPLQFLINVRNEGAVTADNVRLKLILEVNDAGGIAKGTIAAANVPAIVNEVPFGFVQPMPRTTLFYEGAWLYRNQPDDGRLVDAQDIATRDFLVGELAPGELVWLVVSYWVSESTRTEDPCTTIVATDEQAIEIPITIDNPSPRPLHDVHVSLSPEYSANGILVTVRVTGRRQSLRTTTIRALATQTNLRLRYRDAEIYTSKTRTAIDASEAIGAGIRIGTVPANTQMLLRITYDVAEVNDA